MLLLPGHEFPVYSLAFSPDSELLASAAKIGGVRLWGPGGGLVAELPYGLPGPRYAITYAPNGERVAVSDGTGYLELWPNNQGRTACIGKAGVPETTGLAYLDDALLAVGTGGRARSEPGSLALWDLTAAKRRSPVHTEPHGVRAVASHRESRTVFWVNGHRRLSAWSITKPDPIHLMLKHVAPALAVHPDGNLAAVAQGWGASVLDLSRKQERFAIAGHKGVLSSLAFTPDGRTLLTGSWDSSVRFWDAASGAELASYRWPVGRVYAVAASPDGTRFAAAGETGAIVVWDAD